MDHDPVYDFVIGNPPYFQYLKRDMSDTIRKKFDSILKGRPNIYSLFIKASIDALKDNGKLGFVVPLSMNNGDHFSKLRDYIIEKCDIECLEQFGDDEFKDAEQSVQIIVLRRLCPGQKNNGKYIFKQGEIQIITTEAQKLKQAFQTGRTLKQMGFEVMTGNFVWNQNKDVLTRVQSDNIRLIWACNIVDNTLVWDPKKLNLTDPTKTSHQKGQYVKYIMGEHSLTRLIPHEGKWKPQRLPQPINVKSIVVNRVTGTANNATLRAAIVDIGEYYFVENHVNYIVATESAAMSLEELYKLLIQPSTVKMINSITGNTQISKKEMENLIPFSLDKVSE